MQKVLEIGRQGYRHVLDADISGFFDNLTHTAIMHELSNEVADGNILRLVEKFLKAGVMEGGKLRRTHKGTPQGGVASPLLANIALNVETTIYTKGADLQSNYDKTLFFLLSMSF